MAEHDKQLLAASALRSDELGVVLASLGPDGDSRSRLSAVVALLTGDRAVNGPSGGAFADAAREVTNPFTTGLHNYLREPRLNAARPAFTKSA